MVKQFKWQRNFNKHGKRIFINYAHAHNISPLSLPPDLLADVAVGDLEPDASLDTGLRSAEEGPGGGIGGRFGVGGRGKAPLSPGVYRRISMTFLYTP